MKMKFLIFTIVSLIVFFAIVVIIASNYDFRKPQDVFFAYYGITIPNDAKLVEYKKSREDFHGDFSFIQAFSVKRNFLVDVKNNTNLWTYLKWKHMEEDCLIHDKILNAFQKIPLGNAVFAELEESSNKRMVILDYGSNIIYAYYSRW